MKSSTRDELRNLASTLLRLGAEGLCLIAQKLQAPDETPDEAQPHVRAADRRASLHDRRLWDYEMDMQGNIYNKWTQDRVHTAHGRKVVNVRRITLQSGPETTHTSDYALLVLNTLAWVTPA